MTIKPVWFFGSSTVPYPSQVLTKCLLTGWDLKNTETFRSDRKLPQEAAGMLLGNRAAIFPSSSLPGSQPIITVGNYIELMFGGGFVFPVFVLGKLGL